jgi:hypothetical protein
VIVIRRREAWLGRRLALLDDWCDRTSRTIAIRVTGWLVVAVGIVTMGRGFPFGPGDEFRWSDIGWMLAGGAILSLGVRLAWPRLSAWVYRGDASTERLRMLLIFGPAFVLAAETSSWFN